MKILSKLFRPEPPAPAPNPPTMEESIAALNAAAPADLLQIALGDGDEPLRAAAVQRLPDGDELRRMAGFGSAVVADAPAIPAALKRAAQARLAQLIDAGSTDIAAGAHSGDPALLSVIALCQDTARLPHALAGIQDVNQLGSLVAESSSSRVRQIAAEMIQDPAQIRELIKQIRTRDKVVYKILKQKIDAVNAGERKAAELREESVALCGSLERHSHRSHDVHYASTLDHLQSRWRALEFPPDEEIAQRIEQAVDRCKAVIVEYERTVQQQAQHAAVQRAAAEARARERQSEQEAAAAQAAAEALRLQESAAQREAEETILAAAQAAQDQLFRQIGGLVRKAHGALSDGQSQAAAGLRRAIEEKLTAAPTMPPHLLRGVQQLDEKLNELKQWKDFAVGPKRAELIQQMEALVGAQDEPQALAERIKALQQEWKTISKGIVSDPPEDWERFHRAAQAAFQPCREYFDAQAKVRQDNLQARKALVERVMSFEAAQNAGEPDWRLLARVLREAPQEWRRHFPVERDAGRTVQVEFDAAMERLQTRLAGWHEQNVAEKQSLIKRARHLLTLEDGREAIETVKRLQLQWKETGSAPREQEQSLWSEFREACDSIFQRRQQAFADHAAGLEAAKTGAAALCIEVETYAGESTFNPVEARAKIPEWRAAFSALGELPRADARGLRDRFDRALGLCETQMARIRERDAQQSLAQLFEACRHVHAYGLAAAGGAEAAERESLQQAAEGFIAGVAHWPKGALPAIKQSLVKAGSCTGVALELNAKSLRLLCIRAEIHAEIATPAEDESLRREYQVQRLMRGMGQGVSAQEGDWDAMALEWVRTGPVPPALYDTLMQRFMRSRPAKRSARATA